MMDKNNKVSNDRDNDSRTTERKKLSWLELDESELLKLTDVSVCMYKAQQSSLLL